ncbi:prolipoprotein diacylglyceryl transferase family protein, partial [Enterococcus faecium]
TIVDLLLYGLPVSIISARLYYVLFELPLYIDDPLSIFKIWEGGLAIHGGLIGAVLTGVIYCKKKHLSFWNVADVVAPSIVIGQIIGRWGN